MNPEKIIPKSGEESVWDYPRPPKIVDALKKVRIIFNQTVIAESNRAKKALETSHPPVYYIPPEDIKTEFLSEAENRSYCEFKGEAVYCHLTVGSRNVRYACWYYPKPVPGFAELKNHIAFYAGKMDECYVGDEKVTPQPGKFYGGWITREIKGPFKGEEGSELW